MKSVAWISVSGVVRLKTAFLELSRRGTVMLTQCVAAAAVTRPSNRVEANMVKSLGQGERRNGLKELRDVMYKR